VHVQRENEAVRVVMLTDDGQSIDRRILLEAETVADLGHEVIIVARNETGSGVVAERIGRAKVLWVDYDLAYLGGSNIVPELPPLTPTPLSELDQSPAASAMLVPTAHEPPPTVLGRTIAGTRSYALKTYLALDRDRRRMNERLHSATLAWEHPSIRGLRRLRLGLGIARVKAGRAIVSAALKPMEAVIPAKPPRRLQTLTEAAHPVDPGRPVSLDSFEMNIWEKAIFHRTLYFDPDVIHANDLPQLLPAVLAGRQLGVPVIYDAHEVYPEIATLTLEQQEQLRLKESVLVHHCAERITVNPFCAAFMEERYSSRPFHVIMNATQPSKGHVRGQTDDRLRKRLSLPPAARLLMYQGWMADVGRGLLELVAGMASVRKDVHLVMMGYGDADLFKAAAAEADVAARVHILPPVPWDELVSWSAAADVGVIPYQPVDFNHKVCSPNKLFEFISAGLPILANDLPFLTTMIEGEGFGIIRKMETPADMARAINEMFDPALGHIERARVNLLAKASAWEWPVQAEKLKAIYERITDTHPHSG
jgi:glycosyltransferase involved in cell wall biosynthesis